MAAACKFPQCVTEHPCDRGFKSSGTNGCSVGRAGEARGAHSAEGRAALLQLLQLLGEGWLLLCMFRCGVRARRRPRLK